MSGPVLGALLDSGKNSESHEEVTSVSDRKSTQGNPLT